MFNVYCHESRHSKFCCIVTMINKVSLSLTPLAGFVPVAHVPVAQWLEHCVSSAKVVGSIPREHMY